MRSKKFWNIKKLHKGRSLILAVLLFFLSMGVPPVVARISIPSPIVQNRADAANLVEQGNLLYKAGRFEEAATVWQQAVSAFAELGDSLNRAMASSNLSLSYQQLGQWDEAREAIAQSLNILQTLENTTDKLRILAQSLDVQGKLQREFGQGEDALETWQKAANIYAEIGDKNRITQSLINQAQTMLELGLSPRACKILLAALEIEQPECKISELQLGTLKEQPDSLLVSQGLRSLGDVLRVVGQLQSSERVLQESLKIAEQLRFSQDVGAANLSLGNTVRLIIEQQPLNPYIEKDYTKVLNYYKQAEKLSASPVTRLQAQLNILSLLVETKNWLEAAQIGRSLAPKINSLSASKTGVFAQINFARSLMKMASMGAKEQAGISQSPIPNLQEIDQILARAAQQAKSLGSQRAYVYAEGDRGKLYELARQWEQAEKFTYSAIKLASIYQSPDIASQLLWQVGRIRKQRGDIEGAIASYTTAVTTLQSIRTDLVTISSEVQFSFRESVEPVYRELVDLLLQPKAEPSALMQARNAIESLQLAELDNFFRDACVTFKPVQIDQIDPTAAVFYTIILGDRLEVISALPNLPLRHYTTYLPQKEIETTLSQLRGALPNIREPLSLERSQKLYDWLIRPIEAELASSGVKTLVFILDGALRNIPMAALHDGKQYLVEKYSIALTPSLQLLDPRPLARQEFKTLSAGLSEARQGFSALPGVELELERIKSEVPTKILLNQSFTEANLQATIKSSPFPVVHLATHGNFSSQAENTFILTWDDRINANELNNLLRADSDRKNPIELLVLSACQTAVGDNRAALGLAGVAVRAGARSTVASMWLVSDRATAALMTRFYQELANKNVTKSEALRRAQLSILQDEQFAHPYYWAAFVLVGNWL